MADAIDRVLRAFEGLIRRSIAPSVTLFVLLAAGELIAAELTGWSVRLVWRGWARLLDDSLLSRSTGFFVTVAILVVLGLGYALSSVQQALFDHPLKASFEPGRLLRILPSMENERRALVALRTRVLARIGDEPRLLRLAGLEDASDFLLYEILGGIDPTDTRPFVDSAKAFGVVVCSAITVLVWNLVVYWSGAPVVVRLVLMLLVLVAYWIGREATCAQYRQRALRLYVNFLMMPEERLERRLLRPQEAALPVAKGEPGS